MTPRTILSAAVGGIILMGCAYSLPSVMSTRDCNGQHCEVAVSAKPHDATGFSCFVDRVDPYELVVNHPRPVTVNWYLDSGSDHDGYRFTDAGIVFDDPTGWKCGPLASNTRFQCINTAVQGRHKYTVNLVKGSTRCEPYDPYVVNP